MWEQIITDAGARYSVPESWINAVIDTESSRNPNAYRWEPARQEASYGLMQILASTAKGLGFTGDVFNGLYDPAVNIDLGAKLLGQLRGRYGDDFTRVYSAYNSGKPDTWQTSAQVAANVKRALGNLANYAEGPAGAGVIVLAVVGIVLYLAMRK
jgi:soluble lytic murein transglycosylase-like protein